MALTLVVALAGYALACRCRTSHTRTGSTLVVALAGYAFACPTRNDRIPLHFKGTPVGGQRESSAWHLIRHRPLLLAHSPSSISRAEALPARFLVRVRWQRRPCPRRFRPALRRSSHY